MKANKMILYGKDIKDTTEKGSPDLQLIEAYEFSTTRDAGEKKEIDLSENKQYEFTLSDNTTWQCDMYTMHELFPGVKDDIDRSGNVGGFELPTSLQSGTAERGIVGDIALKLIKVFAKKTVSAGIGVVAKRLDDKHLMHGLDEYPDLKTETSQKKYLEDGAALFRLNKDFNFSKFDGKRSDKPFLLFIHGTNSDTRGAFIRLKDATEWNNIYERYGDNVIAFQHRTLTESPLLNVVKLAGLLPDKAELHIISHSRGGIVGDILSKYSSIDKTKPVGFSATNIAMLEKEGRNNDADCIRALNELFKTKKINVSRFIRVACPAAGTILASKRLDIMFNVLGNLLGGEANPFIDTFKELISEAIKTKDKADVLPGVEAQSPSSAFIKILNDQSEENSINADPLAVIAGDGKFSFSMKGLATILSNLFYWQRNDWVVNTDSMYLGVSRKGEIQYFFEEGGHVNHMDYFLNNSSREAISYALATDPGKSIPGYLYSLQTEIPASDRGLDHGELFPNSVPPSGKKPIVVLLPGIMGSNLYDEDKRLWLNYWGMLKGGLKKIDYDGSDNIEPRSVVKTSYNSLKKRLDAAYDVVIFPYDWRKQLNECAAEFNDKIIELLDYKQPIKIIGHSMGGVLVRDFIINYSNTWQILNATKDFRLLFLGAPLGGSHRILTVLYGQDSIINSLNMIDPFHNKKDLVNIFRKFPGILSLLPLTTDKENDFSKQSVWDEMRKAEGKNDWPIPEKDDLDVFEKYRENILAKKDTIDYDKIIYIAGKDKSTPCGYFKDEIPPRKELVFLYTEEGDQSVTWDSGIPHQVAAKGNVYYVPVSHGALACDDSIFDGIEEIIEKGSTSRLSKIKPSIVARGEQKKSTPQVENFNFDFSEKGIKNTLLGISYKQEKTTTKVPLKVCVSNGDLAYTTYPVLAGHFLNDEILYAEKAVNMNLNKKLSESYQLGVYPGEICTHEIVIGNKNIDRIPGAIIVGLGEQGNFTAFQLARTVEQAVAKYLLLVKELPNDNKELGISALIIGSGYGGLTIESSVKAILEGINNANSKIQALLNNNPASGNGKAIKLIRNVEFTELYRDRALSCLYALRKIESAETNTYNAFLSNKKIRELLGAKKRLPTDTSEEWWNRISVKLINIKKGDKQMNSLLFGASTNMAREEEQELFAGTQLIDLFIEEISTRNSWNDCTAKTLFELMIPNDFKDRLKRKGNITWVLNEASAAYPWELLQDNTANAKPLCINAGMVRQLSIREYRAISAIKRVIGQKVLIVADPLLNGFINQLPGARDEGIRVDETMRKKGYTTNALIAKTAGEIVKSVFCDEYKIMHLAGHGVYNPEIPQKSGMVIGDDVFLSVFDIEQMPVVPELVFVNCCHLGKVNASFEKYFKDRYKLAANIGTQLIQIGVKAVVVAGWAVDDSAASDFAEIFYTKMFDGYTFGDAVKEARKKIYDDYKQRNNTWGAYQCYGDPFYKFKNDKTYDKKDVDGYLTSEQAETDLENLLNQLDTGNLSKKEVVDKLKIIIKEVEAKNLRNADITEKEALIYLEMVMYPESVDKFKLLLGLEKANFSFSCMEKFCNARAKLCIREYFAGNNPKNHKKAINEIDAVINDLKILRNAGETAERLNLLGSSYKRKAMLAADESQRKEAFKLASYSYGLASKKAGNKNETYSITNAIEIESILVLSGSAEWGAEYSISGKRFKLRTKANAKQELERLQQKIESEIGTGNLDYWNIVASINIKLCKLLLGEKPNLANNDWDEVTNDFNFIWKKAGSAGKRAAEIEHIQFLTYALSTINKRASFVFDKKINSGDEENIENLSANIKQLKEAFTKAISKKRKSIPAKPKAVKKQVLKNLSRNKAAKK